MRGKIGAIALGTIIVSTLGANAAMGSFTRPAPEYELVSPEKACRDHGGAGQRIEDLQETYGKVSRHQCLDGSTIPAYQPIS